MRPDIEDYVYNNNNNNNYDGEMFSLLDRPADTASGGLRVELKSH